MYWFCLAACATTLMTLTPIPARAQGFISPYIGFNYGGDSANCASLRNCEEKRMNWGVSLGKTGGVFGVEADFGYAPHFFGKAEGADNAVLHFMSNVLLVIPAGPIQPYGLIGIGLIRPHAKLDASSLSLTKNALGYDIGGGINIFLARSVGIRGDVRHIRTMKNLTLGVFTNDKLDFWRASAGLTFRF